MLYFPTPAVDAIGADRLTVSSGGETINVWRSGIDYPDAILYFGGNAEPVAFSHREYQELFPKHAIYMMEYRGYGHSSGKSSEVGLSEDALAVFDVVASKHRSMVIVGRSLGSGLATYLATNRSISTLILITPYDSILNVAQSHFPLLPVGLLLRDRYESVANVPNIAARTLIVSAQHDSVIPSAHSERLAAAFSSAVLTKIVVPNTDHNSVANSPEFKRALRAHVMR